jgi:hypothetical protein
MPRDTPGPADALVKCGEVSVSGEHPPLRKLSPYSVVWQGSVVVGWAVFATAAAVVATVS